MAYLVRSRLRMAARLREIETAQARLRRRAKARERLIVVLAAFASAQWIGATCIHNAKPTLGAPTGAAQPPARRARRAGALLAS